MPAPTTKLQQRLGRRVRQRRTELGLTMEQLAGRSTVSSRFVSEVEAGRANISIRRLASIAEALEVSLTSLLEPPPKGALAAIRLLLEQAKPAQLEQALRVFEVMLGHRTPRVVALLGVRGAGKSTVGASLAGHLGLPFIELDQLVEKRAGMPLSDIFTLHGEPFYRRQELACLQQLIEADERVVVALSGGVVTSEPARALIEASCTAVWLKATAEDCWSRVFTQGDLRPMAGREDAMAELRALVSRRAPLYAQAQLSVDTSSALPDQVVTAILAELDGRGLRP